MLEGKELILSTKKFTVENRTKSWLAVASTLLMLCALQAFVLVNHIVLLNVAASLLLSLIMVRMFVLYHDFLHHAILHKSKLANVLMTLFGIYILAAKSIWKRSHDHHHKHNSKLFSASIGSYPVATAEKFRTMSAGERRYYLFIRHPLTILFAYFFMFQYGMCLGAFASSPKKHIDALLSWVLHIAGSVCVFMFLGWQAWLFGIFIPFFIATCIGAYLFYAQHNFPGVSFHANADWAYEKAALQSSSYLKMNKLMHWFTCNIGYHHIHHLNSRIPFYRLPEAMEQVPELQNVGSTTLMPADIYKCLRLKVWDATQGKMIGLKELRNLKNAAAPIKKMPVPPFAEHAS